MKTFLDEKGVKCWIEVEQVGGVRYVDVKVCYMS